MKPVRRKRTTARSMRLTKKSLSNTTAKSTLPNWSSSRSSGTRKSLPSSVHSFTSPSLTLWLKTRWSLSSSSNESYKCVNRSLTKNSLRSKKRSISPSSTRGSNSRHPTLTQVRTKVKTKPLTMKRIEIMHLTSQRWSLIRLLRQQRSKWKSLKHREQHVELHA